MFNALKTETNEIETSLKSYRHTKRFSYFIMFYLRLRERNVRWRHRRASSRGRAAPRVPHCLDQLRVDVKPHPMRKNDPSPSSSSSSSTPEPNRTMIALFNKLLDWFKALFWKEEMELTLVGLQYSGKTTFVNVIAVIKLALSQASLAWLTPRRWLLRDRQN